MAAFVKVKVRYTYDAADKAWLVNIPSVKNCHTFGRTLRQARARAREVYAMMMLDVPEAEAFRRAKAVEFVEEFAGPKPALEAVRNALQARALLAEATKLADEKTREGVREASKVFSLRDAADLFGLSHQRVQQLAKEPKSAKR